MACTEGPRFETPAETRMLRYLGSDIVGMTSAPEVFLAREAGLCYASLSYVTNMASGLKKKVSHADVIQTAETLKPTIIMIIADALGMIGAAKNCTCSPPMK